MKRFFRNKLCLLVSIVLMMLFPLVDLPAYAVSDLLTPTNFGANLLSTGFVELTWSPVNNATSYTIEGTIGSEKYWFIVPLNPTTYLVPIQIQEDQNYYFRIEAKGNNFNDSPLSVTLFGSRSTSFVEEGYRAPELPTNFKATPLANGSVDFTWEDNANNEIAYELSFDNGDGKPSSIFSLDPNSTVWNHTFYDKKQTDVIKLCVKDGKKASEWVEMRFIQPICEMPTGLTATKDKKGVVTLTWQDNSTDEIGFEVEKTDDDWWRPTETIGPNVTTYIDDTPHIKGRTYTYAVRSLSPNSDYNSYYSPSVSVKFDTDGTDGTTVVPGPTNLKVTNKMNGSIMIQWQDNAEGEKNYIVYTNGGGNTDMEFLPPNTTSWVDSVMHQPGTYTYYVNASHPEGNSGFSNNVTVVVPDPNAHHLNAVLDNTASKWAYEGLQSAFDYGLIEQGHLVNLKNKITREEFCAIVVTLYEKLSGKLGEFSRNPFGDTTNPQVLKAYDLGIVNGTSATTFSPNATISRQEMCVMILKCLKAVNPELAMPDQKQWAFKDDSSIGSWAKDAVKFCYSNEIINGLSTIQIAPLNNTTREQAYVLLKRTFEKFK